MLSKSEDTTSSDWYYQLRQTIDQRISVQEERWFSFVRDLKSIPVGEAHKYDYLVEFFVDEILGPYDQDISLLMVGNKGRGKSLAGLALSYFSACEIAERIGGKWTDYFNPDTNLAVILESEANSVMSIQEKYQVKDYDDIGIGWGARNWQDADNKNKNDVFQINRTDSTLQVFSVPNQFLLDKVPRSLVSHYAEMAQQFFAHGFTTLKMFEPETLFREGKIIQPYLNVDRTKYVLFRIPKPPEDLIAYYKKRRALNKSLATKKRMDGEEYPDVKLATEKAVKKSAAVRAMEQDMFEMKGPIMDIIKDGGSKEDIMAELMENHGFSKKKANRWVKSKSFAEIFPTTT
jgi:hypothetical protein